MKTYLVVLSVLILNLVQGQDGRREDINLITDEIDSSLELTTKEFDAVEVCQTPFDGGGIITIKHNEQELKMVKEEIGLSFGRVTTCIYFDNGKPIKLIESEENFPMNHDESGFDYTVLNQVFKATFWIYNWNMDEMDVVREGKRISSDGTCSIYEYSPLIELGERLMKE